MSTPPPTEALAELISVIGEDDTKDLIRTFLSDFPPMIRTLSAGEIETKRRTVHSLKSTARHMGALALSRRMALFETKLSQIDADLSSADITLIVEEFEKAAVPLRAYLGR